MNAPTPDPFDRALAAYSAREQARPIPPPAGFADRTTAAVLARPRWRVPRWAYGVVFAVGVVAAAVIGYPMWSKPGTPAEPLKQLVVVEPSGSMSVR